MTSKELEQKLNKLSDKIKFSVKEYDKDGTTLSADSDRLTLLGVSKGEIWIYAVLGDHKMVLAKIMPPCHGMSHWSFGTESNISRWDYEGLNIYMGVIKLAHQFMADKEKGNE